MIKVQLKEAETDLGRLLEEATAGEDVVIEGAQGATVRLVPVLESQNGEDEQGSHQPIGNALDRYIGTWSAEQEAEIREAVASLRLEPRKPYREVLAEIRLRQSARGHQPRTREEIDASLQSERESWGQ